MFSPKPASGRSHRSLFVPTILLAFAGLSAMPGCSSPHAQAPAAVIRVRAVPAVYSASAAQTAAASLALQPLYQQAQHACARQRYAEAARLLQRLAALPTLTAEERAFAEQQRRLCLQDAGLPVPQIPPAPASLPPVVSHAGSPADADCGPRALLLVCERLGVQTSLAQLRQFAGTTPTGTSLAGLARACAKVGLKAEGVQVSREALPDMDMPALAYVNGNHFVAVFSLQGSGEEATATIYDPNAAGEETIPQERLLRLCSGYLLLARR